MSSLYNIPSHSTGKSTSETLFKTNVTAVAEFLCDRSDHGLERIVKGICNFGLEEKLSVKNFRGCSVELGRWEY